MPDIRHIVFVGDTHCGCSLAIYPPGVPPLDDARTWTATPFQHALYAIWQEFWSWVDHVTDGAPYAVCHMGDAIDGVHHDSVSQITHNLEDQTKIALALLRPVVDRCKGQYVHIRGTEAHVGKSAQWEESLARQLGAIPNSEGQYARYDLNIQIGPYSGHAMHHIGTCGSMSYESTALNKELTETMLEAVRGGRTPPDFIVRGHRHRYFTVTQPTHRGYSYGIITPSWQGKTPFAWKVAGARVSTPQFGGVIVVAGDEDLYHRQFVKFPLPSAPVLFRRPDERARVLAGNSRRNKRTRHHVRHGG